MGQYNGAVITTAGQAVLAQAIGGAELTITKVVTSATAIPPGTDLTALTTIADVEQTEQPTSAQVFNDNIVQISTRFSNAGVAAAYLIQTLGVFGQVTGGVETLLAVSTAITPDQMPAEDAIAPSAFIYNMQLTVQSADQITVTVNDAGTATVADLQALDEAKLDKDGDGENVTVTFDDVNNDPDATTPSACSNSLVSGITLTSLLKKLKTVFKYAAPKDHHAGSASTYGAGNDTQFGHVRLSDVYNSQIGTASQSIGASQKAVYDVWSIITGRITWRSSEFIPATISSTSWGATTASFTVPAGHAYLIFLTCRSGAEALNGLAICGSIGNPLTYSISEASGTNLGIYRTPAALVGGGQNGITLYAYAKKKTSGSVAVSFVFEYFDLNA